jgi:hypothetical protein
MPKRIEPRYLVIGILLLLAVGGAFFGAYQEYRALQEFRAELDQSKTEYEDFVETFDSKFAEFRQSYCGWMFAESEFATVGDGPLIIYVNALHHCPQIWGELKLFHYLDNLVQKADGGLVKLESVEPYAVSFGMDTAVATEVTTRTEYPDGDVYYLTEYILSDDFPIYGLTAITVEPCESERVAQEHELVIKICGEEK